MKHGFNGNLNNNNIGNIPSYISINTIISVLRKSVESDKLDNIPEHVPVICFIILCVMDIF